MTKPLNKQIEEMYKPRKERVLSALKLKVEEFIEYYEGPTSVTGEIVIEDIKKFLWKEDK